MADFLTVLKLLRINIGRNIGSRKTVLIAVMSVIFGFYVYIPVTRMALYYHQTIPPAAFVFYFSHNLMMIFQGGFAVLLFSDILREDGYSLWCRMRSGRSNFILGQCLYILVMSAIAVLFLVMISLIFTSPVLGSFKDWGQLMRRLSRDRSTMMQESGVKDLVFHVRPTVLKHFSPLGALAFAALCMWLVFVFMGMLILCLSVLVSRNFGIAFAGIMVCMTIVALYGGALVFGYKLLYVSPVSWNSLSMIDFDRSGEYPSPQYVLSFLIAGIILMSVITCIRYRNTENQ